MLLALDTATRMLSIALHDGRRICAESAWETANRHTVEVVPAIHRMCEQATIAVQDIRVIAVSQGPGSFSGLRIGIGAAKGLAMALSIPLIGVPTLDIVAAAQPRFDGSLIALAQAGRGRSCVGRYAWESDVNGWKAAGDVAIMTWDALIESISGPTLLAGEVDEAVYSLLRDGRYADQISIARPALNVRRAGILADIGWARFRQTPVSDPASIVPIYVNQPGVPHP